MTDERVISDLSICQPSSALSRQWQDGKWMLMDYETDDGIVGQMLYYTFYPVFHAAMRRPRDQEFVNAPMITLPLEASGWYEICLGMHYASAARLEGPQIQVKLSGEEMYSVIGREQCQPKDGDFPEKSGFGIFDVAEVSWRTADITDQDLVIAPPGLYYGNDQFFTNLLYLRLIPVPDGQTSRYPIQQPSEDTKRLIAYYGGPPNTVEAARNWVDCFRDSDFSLILWGAGPSSDPEICEAAIQQAGELDIAMYGSIRFAGQVRAMLDEEEARTGVRLGTAYHAMNSVANSLYFNMDVETWIRQGLVDHCIVHPTHSVEPNMPDPGDFTPEFLTQYVEMARGTACKVYADVYPRRMPAEDYRRKAITYYDAGVDGLSLWDTHTRRSRCSEWSMIHLLGHRDELSSWGERTKDVFRKTSLRTFQGITTNRAYSFTDG